MKNILAVWLMTFSVWVSAENAMVFQYQEREAGVSPYPLRLLITDGFVRVDEGRDEGGFVLYDRKQGRIYNVLEEDAQVLVVDPELAEVSRLPVVQISYQAFTVADAPPIAGITPQGFHLMADGEKCAHSIVAPGLLPAASEAMVEFQKLLGRQSLATLENTPIAFQTPCFLAENILQPDWNWQQGFPVHTWDNKGYRSELLDYQEQQSVPDRLFQLPASYGERPLQLH